MSRTVLAATLLVLCLGHSSSATAQSAVSETMRPLLWQADMAPSTIGEINVFRRFSSDRTEQMTRFYADVLGFAPLAEGAPRMIRYPIGASEVKLFPSPPSAPSTAAVRELAGLRLLTYFFADEASLVARLKAFEVPAPTFKTSADGRRATLVRDPDGEWLELVVLRNATPEQLARFEVGIGVADLQASRAFYRDLMGLTETGPAHDELLGTDKYTYRHRTTTINVWQAEANAPKDAETAGIQYIVWDVEAVNELAVRRAARITTPLAAPSNMRTVWLADPDGVANYFAQFAGQDNSPPRSRAHDPAR
jgi:catechol 2,3-dioxygenase-like lactoylglutathione lyase family enzyme